MFRIVLKFGVIAGLIVGTVLFGMSVAMAGKPPMSFGMVFGYVSMLIALSTVFMGVKRYRDVELGGVIRFWPAFGMGLAISLIASIIYVLAWEASLAVTNLDFAASYSQVLIEQKKAQGMSGEELVKFIAQMEDFKVMYAKPLFRLPMTFAEIFPVGLLVSLVTAGLLRNSRFMAVQRT